jgi:hypothetical protein
MKKLFFLILIAGIAIALFFGYFKCIDKQEQKIKMLESKISLLKETQTPIRFKILKKTADSIKFSAKFYNADAKEINKIETTIHGQELSFDFFVVPIKDRYVAFPYKIFSNQIAAANGIELYSFYNTDGFPSVFGSKDIDPVVREGLTEIFQKIRNNQLDSLNKYFGNMVHDIKEFKSFIPQTVYSINTHTKGGIEIIEE